MITDEEYGACALAGAGRWTELLDLFRQVRGAAAVAGCPAAGWPSGPIGHLIAYGAPPEVAARLFDADGGPDTAAGAGDHDAGPLWEVLATRHSWRRLAPLLDPPPIRRLVAHTRALLGDELGGRADPDPEGVPLLLQPWEQAGWEERSRVRDYLPGGGARRALLAQPATREGLGRLELPGHGTSVPGLTATRLLGDLAPWLRAVCVRGTAPDAAARFAEEAEPTAGYLPFGAVYPALVQAASGEPALGSADGRLALWRALTAMTGEPRPGPADVNALVARLRCLTWCEPQDELWYLHLALEDPATGLAWAISGAASA
ncbi:hypothetical protein [Kitasatospora sp. NPDC059571]|uniref:hypothetical protein n=1 Tax=Kitasatospora sp. NPDC059571 TaxID=3346871 RepID=UPI003695CABC